MSPKSKKIVANVDVGSGANQWYGTIITNNIRCEDGTAVTIKKFLGVKFKSPTVSGSITVNTQLDPWQQTSADISTEKIDDKSIIVTAKVQVEESHTFKAYDTLTWSINGNLMDNPEKYTNSFELYADELPSGTVDIECAAAPQRELANSEQALNLVQDDPSTMLSVSPGTSKSFNVISGKYTVTADDLTDSAETVVAGAKASPGQVTITTGGTTAIKVAYSAVQKYCAIDVSIGQLSSPIDKALLHVTIVDHGTGKAVAEFFNTTNSKTNLRRLPSTGQADFKAQITINNVKYSAAKTLQLVNRLIDLSVAQSDVKIENINTSGFVDLPVKIDTDLEKPGSTILARLMSMDGDVIYTEAIHVNTNSNSNKFAVKVAPGDYKVEAKGFVTDFTVYAVRAPGTLNVAKDGSTELNLATRRGANINVHGFPNFLSFGGLSDLVDLEGRDFVNARSSSLFKYAGNDGAGDQGAYLADDPATTKTVQLAATVERQLGGDYAVLPVMISYTVNLSLGDTLTQLQNSRGLAHSFGNLILSLKEAKKTGKESVPAGYVVNPDFLGECQKGPEGNGLASDYRMPVREPLQEALDHWSIDAKVPSNIDDTLKGYVFAVNWLIRTVAEKVTFGWQVNVWGVGNSSWIYSKESNTEGPAEMAKKTADYIKSLDTYSGEYRPDFLAVDRYEADDFTERAYVNSYCYGPYEWGRFFDFCGALSLELQVPVMPWQIPASRIPNRTESVVNLESEHWGSGGTYLFGDTAINSDHRNIHPTILAIKPAGQVPHGNVEDIFAAAEPFSLSEPAYTDFAMRGIFTVLLGGGATTGIVSTIGNTSSWTQEKVRKYMEDPIQFN